MSIIGDSFSWVIFSTELSGNSPSGDILYFSVNTANISVKSGSIPMSFAFGKTIKQNLGKVTADFNFTGFVPCSILNHSIQFLDKSIRTTPTSKAVSLYLWVLLTNNEYLKFRNGETDVYTDYSNVLINSYNFDVEGGNNITKFTISASFGVML